nr:hypothetical protein [Tanacetum cinerariifolium]
LISFGSSHFQDSEEAGLWECIRDDWMAKVTTTDAVRILSVEKM